MTTKQSGVPDAMDELQRALSTARDFAVGFEPRWVTDLRRASEGLLAALSSPPADDVREALAAVLDDSLLCWTYNGTHTVFHPTKGADAVLARFEVRPRGTVTDAEEELSRLEQIAGKVEASRGQVTDAEVERVALLLWADYDAEHAGSTVDQFFGQARRLLEAARGARVSAENTTPTNHADGSTT